ncbi:MAG: homoserine kinase [Desulfobacula sp.]|uniref:homoserine kinase n=1 Tax=Desulfobacula sp. TaxID=2593537 RepID=UPI002A094726|nr:homoserine kinase [Desulfobacula sp.]MBT6747364.1 homoserine kinase [Desulfobacula sp.]MBT7792230.1 homoserine kinase [Desulfobacula sp.]
MIKDIGEISKICELYGIQNIVNAKLLTTGFANRNYKITTEEGNFFYRVCTQQKDVKNIIYETNILLELQKINFPTAYLIPKKEGGFISNSKEGKVLIYEFKEGSNPELNHQTTGEIAKYLAELNSFKGFVEYPRKNIIHIDYCFELIELFKIAPFQYPEIYEYFEEQTQYLLKPVSKILPRGLIHGDVFPDNTIFQNGILSALIDFEEACVDNLLMEIGMCINGFCFINNTLDLSLMETFLYKYNQIRQITKKEWELLYDYIQWAAHGMLSWHLRHFLIYKQNPKQLSRVNELMERVKKLRQNSLPKINRPGK